MLDDGSLVASFTTRPAKSYNGTIFVTRSTDGGKSFTPAQGSFADACIFVGKPRVTQILMNTTFRMFPDSDAAKGAKGEKAKLSPEAIAMQQMMRGIHF